MKNGKRTTRWLYWAKLFAGLIVLYFVYAKINQRESILQILQSTNQVNLLICLSLLVPNVMLSFIKWRYLLHKKFPDISNKDVFGSLMFGYTLGLITPGNLGELARSLFFKDRDKLSITGLNILDKLANQLVIFTLGSLSVGAIISMKGNDIPLGILVILGGFILFLLALWGLLFNPVYFLSLLRKFSLRLPPNKIIPNIINGFDGLTRKDIAVITSITICLFLVIVCQFHLLIIAFTPIPFQESYISVTGMLFTKTLLPITFGDIGIREYLTVFFYEHFSVSQAVAFNASIIIYLCNVLLPAIGGLYYLFKLKLNKEV